MRIRIEMLRKGCWDKPFKLINSQKLGLLSVLVIILLTGNIISVTGATWQSKVDEWVIREAAASDEQETEFLVFLNEQADLSGAAKLTNKADKGHYVYQRLRSVAERTQEPVLAALAAQGVESRPFWIANMLWVRGNLNDVEMIARRPDVAKIYSNPTVRFQEVENQLVFRSTVRQDLVEWNIALVNADDVWGMGYTGQGVVIGGQDTGYEWDHPALVNQYRGWDGSAADHNYSWHDGLIWKMSNKIGFVNGDILNANDAFTRFTLNYPIDQ